MNPRALAILVLARVRATDAYLNVVLDTMLSESPPKDPRDAGLATELAYGTTRRQLALDYAITRFADRKLEAMEDRVLAALRIGAYQIFHTRVPARAAVAETVQALKEVGLTRAAGFTNAILRKLAELPAPPLPSPTDVAHHLSVRESHPQWLVERWLRQFGRERAESMLVADNQSPPVVIRANTSKVTRDALLTQLQEVGVEAKAATISPVGIILPPVGRIEDVYGYSEGLWQVQDEAAQLVGVYGAIPDNARVLDVCAAPGGKSCHQAQSHDVVAVDLHAHKLRKIESEVKRLGLTSRLKAYAHDASEPFPEAWGEFHAMLVDAPCSGLGTLRRHPELRYRRKEEDVSRLAALQRRILENCQEAVPAGGLLVYAVCTLEPQEGQDQVEMFLRSHPEWTAEPPVLPGLKLPLTQAYLRTLPGPEGFDGFFAARLRKMY
ncbi:16S rRNA (cytosine(967)-C(5))-methyltransferase RsmB [Myxococcus sp. CA051A]|uniref:16S rRNA (cytosine(967)-C(5))-methyltransferase n=1 Tax=Myxococcus llanfairpwllgwyngyllgogerychwyrndrobwllllantysiliogogogochensis TaxID=2590453 RepID=A0A540WL32_9BACT|nr:MULTISPECIES: 16S rRNA (cytosine(967)-C(5))-methyltransferase RsmB [Myxococcus]NTX04951.1 16S rRNA (cytosine(967)-C(5))-methyltransferase RsmB [Myxococcus sp. CA040A]NTX37943.1 16S rRNA (cytosine(967)-C(5))-methyltransferase RsmB [Myxococcus sp. CA033]NTX54348.1 16S rRNA (cytosine(967)-C(5))-methyltransferase RsmB [Myxococcus sp. CA039A]NTX61592.1 16S rRNA (cytosine(967)-C(5))-methyltransferase RsmB [Myxococcus sp. CA051A]TQF09721.1 16S rRNA (cytosine(967)-C(5))-methyltransferase RsmB [Myxo